MKVFVKCAIEVNKCHDMRDVVDWCFDEFGSREDIWDQTDYSIIEFYRSIDDANLFLIYWDSEVVDSVIEDRYTATIMANTLFDFD